MARHGTPGRLFVLVQISRLVDCQTQLVCLSYPAALRRHARRLTVAGAHTFIPATSALSIYAIIAHILRPSSLCVQSLVMPQFLLFLFSCTSTWCQSRGIESALVALRAISGSRLHCSRLLACFMPAAWTGFVHMPLPRHFSRVRTFTTCAFSACLLFYARRSGRHCCRICALTV